MSCFPSSLWKPTWSRSVDLGFFGTIFDPSPSFDLSEKILASLVKPSSLLETIPTHALLWQDEEGQLHVEVGILPNLSEIPAEPSHSSPKHSEDICSQEIVKR